MSTLRVIALTAVIAPVFATFPAFAEDDPAHPAYHFEPEILQRAVEVVPAANAYSAYHADESALAALEDGGRHPGAYFIPTVLYLDPSLAR